MIEDSLRQIGLTDGEIRVYLALLELGATTIGSIIKKSGISGSKAYEVLDRLMKKGLANFITKNNVKYFEAANPERILNYLEEKEKALLNEKEMIQKILPALLNKENSSKNEVKIFTGFEGLKTANEDIIASLKKGEEWLSMGLTEQPESWELYFNERQKLRAKKGIRHKHLINEKYKSLFKKRRKLPYTEFRFLPESFEMPTSTEIYRDKVIIMILLKESPMAIMIENRSVADSFRKHFSFLWNLTQNN